MTSLLRQRDGHHARVGFVELFFDLVFVFAVTQISHTLLAHLTPLGALQAAMTAAAVWWAWIYTSWVTNWLDPERIPVRIALFAIMGAGLLLSTSLPEAFGERGCGSPSPSSRSRSGGPCSCCGRCATISSCARISSASCAGRRWPARSGSRAGWPRARRGCGSGWRRWRSNTLRRPCRIAYRGWAGRSPPTGPSRAATSPSESGCSSSSAWASPCWSPARPSPGWRGRPRSSGPPSSPSSAPWRCGGCISAPRTRRRPR